jgi:hypothetical protein
LRVLLDECLDRRIARDIIGPEVRTVPQMGWAGIKNGELLKLAEVDFDVFVTVDRNLAFQQDLGKLLIGIIVIKAVSNRYVDLEPFVPSILSSLSVLSGNRNSIIHL